PAAGPQVLPGPRGRGPASYTGSSVSCDGSRSVRCGRSARRPWRDPACAHALQIVTNGMSRRLRPADMTKGIWLAQARLMRGGRGGGADRDEKGQGSEGERAAVDLRSRQEIENGRNRRGSSA